MFNKKLKEEIKELRKRIEELEVNSRITFEDKSTFWGFSTVGVSKVLVELLENLGYKLKKRSPSPKVRYLLKK